MILHKLTVGAWLQGLGGFSGHKLHLQNQVFSITLTVGVLYNSPCNCRIERIVQLTDEQADAGFCYVLQLASWVLTKKLDFLKKASILIGPVQSFVKQLTLEHFIRKVK